MRVARVLMLVAVIGAALPVPAWAQQRAAKPPAQKAADPKAAERAPPPPAPDAPTPYDRDLMRLSEIIGAMAFLRGLCASADAPQWPARMKSLMEAEGVSPARRDRLAGAYNRGYRGYALTYRVCTASAQEAAALYAGEGDRLSRALAGRFGG